MRVKLGRTSSRLTHRARRLGLQDLVILLLGVCVGLLAREAYVPMSPLPASGGMQANQVEVCFTPAQRCGPKLIHALNIATTHLHVRAFALTSQPISDALIQAHRRGVKVRVLCDPKQATHPHSKIAMLTQAGIAVRYEKVPGLAHNKVIIVDHRVVMTGSYNFTQGAETRNAENLLLLSHPQTVQRYLEDWKTAWEKALPTSKLPVTVPRTRRASRIQQ